MRSGVLAVLLVLAPSPAGSASGASVSFRLDPATSRVTFTLGATAHTVEGSFAFRSGSVALDPVTGGLSGEIVVDLTTGKTGNGRRDRKMHEEVLESARHPAAVFRPRRCVGPFPSEGRAEVELEGRLSLHGLEHPVTLPAAVTVEDGRVSLISEFSVPYVEWGLEDPSVFVLRVAKEVRVRVEANGSLSSTPAHSTP